MHQGPNLAYLELDALQDAGMVGGMQLLVTLLALGIHQAAHLACCVRKVGLPASTDVR